MSLKDVQSIAEVAKLQFNELEIESMEKSFNEMFDLISILTEVDTDSVEPTYRGYDIYDVYRDDNAVLRGNRDALLANAPSTYENFIEVPVIIESEEA